MPQEAIARGQRMPALRDAAGARASGVGRKWIAVNESYTNYIKGVSRVISQNILGILFDHDSVAGATARLTWSRARSRSGTTGVVQHKGIRDYGGSRRILYAPP